MMETADDTCEQLGDVRLHKPLLVGKLPAMVDGVRTDDTIEYPFLVRRVEVLDSRPVEERKAHHADDLLGTEVHQFPHGDDHGTSGRDHVVGHEDRLSTDIAKKINALDIAVLRVFADDRIVPFLVKDRKRTVQSLGIELVAADGAGIGRYDHQVGIAEIYQLVQLDQSLVGTVEVLQVQCVETVLDLPAVDIQGDDPVDAEHFTEMAEHGSGQSLASALLVLACIRVCRKNHGDGIRTGELQGVDRSEHEHQVVVDRKTHGLVQTGDTDRGLVGDIIDDEYAKPANGADDLSLHFPIGETGVLYIDGKIGALERDGTLASRYLLVVQVVQQRDGLEDFLFRHAMSFRESRRELFIPLDVQPSQMLDYLAGKILRTRTSDDSELMGFDDAHTATIQQAS